MTFAYTFGSLYLAAGWFTIVQLVTFLLAVFWLYRLASLVHEVAHLGKNELPYFRFWWDLIVGVVTLTPSQFYGPHHRDHHSQRLYGTVRDPEYVINWCQPGTVLGILSYFVMLAVFPLVVFVRFLLTPISFLHPKLRYFFLTRCSALSMNWRYRSNLRHSKQPYFLTFEVLCWMRATLIPTAVLIGLTHWSRIPQLYLLAVGVLILNQMRLLADHHFHSDGGDISLSDHIMDSCNYPERDFFTWLFFPFSIRYHALHHIFPSLPYHNLKKTHAYLMQELPDDSLYRTLQQPSWWSVAKKTMFSRPGVRQSPQLAPVEN